MKLATITHYRCSEQDHTSRVWIADDMTDEELLELVHKAQESYLAAEESLKKSATVSNPGYYPDYKKYPSRTVQSGDK